MTSMKLQFDGHAGAQLAARLDLPDGPVRGYALFAHCFTCSKDLLAVKRIAAGLAAEGIALMRFDFTGLGASEGEFASTNFSSNIEDLKCAAAHLAASHGAPELLIGHSLGGAAVLAAAGEIDGVKAVVTIGAPSDVAHVLENFEADLAAIRADGAVEVSLEGRPFTIERQFVEDACAARLEKRIAELKKPLLIMHAPRDASVGIDHASAIFLAAKHPKSFISLDGADHLLSRPIDAQFAADVIAGWAARYLDAAAAPQATPDTVLPDGAVRVTETGQGKFQQRVDVGGHRLIADEPESFGGDDSGPTPYDFLAIGLGACTSMTLRMYGERKKLDLPRLSVEVSHAKVHAKDCAACSEEQQGREGRIDRFERRIRVDGPVSAEVAADLKRIADLCPVHKTLEQSSAIVTEIE
ncbi:bifunctional alpha/beta hydrolase/OsmC family protein [Pseudohoeflea coraliihabitans]|uniref:Bifunctional alpha/beta hydrolase/OsmC family protein n=1 Tax=Pseudohoeflea coraliihabitans TaxID=2860393 RepID=A0ABS6WJT7_9HYPH|nr:bifunctional alpha/beta hydrolase/OsmC family protein [Pseudohoeflea sp. DP4N28-3]MBW3096217.1 bifunctional alpha/beta hydrolase/OsmC family protein [Pseudohoeflea sp. DP4N28-3]